MGVHELTHQKVCHVLLIRTGSVPVSHHVFLYHTMYCVEYITLCHVEMSWCFEGLLDAYF